MNLPQYPNETIYNNFKVLIQEILNSNQSKSNCEYIFQNERNVLV